MHGARAVVAGLVLAALAACAKDPARPHLVLVTVDGLPSDGLGDVPFLRQLAEQCVRFEALETPGTTTFDALAVLHSGLGVDEQPAANPAVARAPGGVGAPLLGTVDTWMERALPRGFETAAVVPTEGLGFGSGLLQGAVHRMDVDALDARRRDPATPRVHVAVEAAIGFLDARLERSVEHGAVMWLHLDLAELPLAERGTYLDGALARLSAALEADPRHVLACWFLPAEGAGSAAAPLWLRVRGEEPRDVRDPARARDIAPTLTALLGVPSLLPSTPAAEALPGTDLLADDAPPAPTAGTGG